MLTESQQKVGKLLSAGCGMMVVGVLLFVFIGGGSFFALAAGPRGLAVAAMAGLGLVVASAGIVVAGYALVMGIREAYSDDGKKPITEAKGCYVIGKLILNKGQEQVFDPDMYEPDELTHLVQMTLPDGRKREFTTHPLMFQTIGEGTRGTAYFQGSWLNRWVQEIGSQPQDPGAMPPPDPFATGQL